MGRAKIIFSQVRAFEMAMSSVSIQYAIPLSQEAKHMGPLRSIHTKDGVLIITYETLPSANEIKIPPIIFEQGYKEITFD
jgi:hypothetical protein